MSTQVTVSPDCPLSSVSIRLAKEPPGLALWLARVGPNMLAFESLLVLVRDGWSGAQAVEGSRGPVDASHDSSCPVLVVRAGFL